MHVVISQRSTQLGDFLGTATHLKMYHNLDYYFFFYIVEYIYTVI